LDHACIVGPRQLEGASFSQHRQAMRASLWSAIASTLWSTACWRLDPGFEPVTFPVLDPDRTTHAAAEQNAQVAIAAPGDFAGIDRLPSRVVGHQSEQAPKARPLEKTSPVPIAATMALEMIGRCQAPSSGRGLPDLDGPVLRFAGGPSMRCPARQSTANSSMTRNMLATSIGARRKDGGQSVRRSRYLGRTGSRVPA